MINEFAERLSFLGCIVRRSVFLDQSRHANGTNIVFGPLAVAFKGSGLNSRYRYQQCDVCLHRPEKISGYGICCVRSAYQTDQEILGNLTGLTTTSQMHKSGIKSTVQQKPRRRGIEDWVEDFVDEGYR